MLKVGAKVKLAIDLSLSSGPIIVPRGAIGTIIKPTSSPEVFWIYFPGYPPPPAWNRDNNYYIIHENNLRELSPLEQLAYATMARTSEPADALHELAEAADGD